MKKYIYFLGYKRKKTKIINHIKNKNFQIVELGNKLLTRSIAKNADLIISFGYRRIISNRILSLVKRPIINLHISYLPFNKGAHPNFWSFVDNTPKGVSIHEIIKKIDSGNIIFRKKIVFKKNDKLTFRQSYNILIKEIENLFIDKFNIILHKKYKTKKIRKIGTIHYSRDLPKYLKNWDVKIIKFLETYHK
jgi:methionyl-tRNA formyltransferase